MFRIIPALSLTGAAGGFVTRQSIGHDHADIGDYPPHPVLYTDFNDRHREGFYLQLYAVYQPLSNLRFHAFLKTVSAGREESGVFGPYWAGAGLDAMAGPVRMRVTYRERRTFGASPEPDRRYVETGVNLFHWQGLDLLWELNAFYRFTFDEEWSDSGLTLSCRFNKGHFLRDSDPFRTVFRERVEGLTTRVQDE